MKKKIGDLTLKEIIDGCNKIPTHKCRSIHCPFTEICDCVNMTAIEDILDQEIEVEEE